MYGSSKKANSNDQPLVEHMSWQLTIADKSDKIELVVKLLETTAGTIPQQIMVDAARLMSKKGAGNLFFQTMRNSGSICMHRTPVMIIELAEQLVTINDPWVFLGTIWLAGYGGRKGGGGRLIVHYSDLNNFCPTQDCDARHQVQECAAHRGRERL